MFKLQIETGNAAFEFAPQYEIARILRECAREVEMAGPGSSRLSLRDKNGNPVGHWEFKP